MSDERTRELERQVEQAPDDATGRHGLTVARLRARRGVVAFWHGTQRPHPAAAKVAFAFECREVEAPHRVVSVPEVLGWCCAVTTPEDLLQLASLRGGCRLYELDGGRCVGLFGEAESVGKLSSPRVQASTTDAFGRPRETHVDAGDQRKPRGPTAWSGGGFHAEDWGDPGRGLRLVPIPQLGAIHARQSLEPLIWDSEEVPTGRRPSPLRFFTNTSHQESGRSKSYGVDTNLGGYGGMPQGHVMVVRGVTILVDLIEGAWASSTLTLEEWRARVVAHVAGAGASLRLTHTNLATFQARLAMPREPGVDLRPGQDDGTCEARLLGASIPAVLPFGAVVVLQPLESFHVELSFPTAQDAPSGFVVRVLLHGDLYRGIAG